MESRPTWRPCSPLLSHPCLNVWWSLNWARVLWSLHDSGKIPKCGSYVSSPLPVSQAARKKLRYSFLCILHIRLTMRWLLAQVCWDRTLTHASYVKQIYYLGSKGQQKPGFLMSQCLPKSQENCPQQMEFHLCMLQLHHSWGTRKSILLWVLYPVVTALIKLNHLRTSFF